MDSHSIHHPEKSLLLFSLQIPFWGKGRKFIGNDPNPPSFTIGGTSASISKGFWRSEMFIPWAKRAILSINRFIYSRFDLSKIVGSLGTLCSNNDPLFGSRILSQLGHVTSL
jgi:hypothetical protein